MLLLGKALLFLPLQGNVILWSLKVAIASVDKVILSEASIILMMECLKFVVLLSDMNENEHLTDYCTFLLPHFVNRIRVPYPFQWGAPSFDAGEAFAMMAVSFVALVEVCFLCLLS